MKKLIKVGLKKNTWQKNTTRLSSQFDQGRHRLPRQQPM